MSTKHGRGPARTEADLGIASNLSTDKQVQRARSQPRFVRHTLQHNVYDFLREGLMSGEFAPGEHLTVRGIAERMGTSVMPVREAFRRLTTEGALELLSSGATRVPFLNQERLENVMEIRSSVEGLAARRAAARMTESEYDDLCSLNDEVLKAARAGDLVREASANERFHFAIYRAARSDELLRVIQHLWLQMGPYLLWLRRRGGLSVRGAFRHHKGILEALRRKDAARAEAALRADLAVAADSLSELARNLPRPVD